MAVKNKIFIPTLISSVDYQPVRTLPHIYFYNGLKDCEPYYIQHYPSGSTAYVETSVHEQFPYLDYYDGVEPTTGSNSLLFFNETPPYGVTPTGSLYTEYWDKYVSLLYNPRTRLINASAIIPLADYFDMELNDIVQWRGNYYHLRAINDYNLKDGTCKIQLLGPIISDAATVTQLDCSFYFSSSIEGLVPTTTSTTTASPTTSTTTLVPTTSTTTAVPTTTVPPTTSTTTAVPTTTVPPTTTTTIAPTQIPIEFEFTTSIEGAIGYWISDYQINTCSEPFIMRYTGSFAPNSSYIITGSLNTFKTGNNVIGFGNYFDFNDANYPGTYTVIVNGAVNITSTANFNISETCVGWPSQSSAYSNNIDYDTATSIKIIMDWS